MMGASEEDETAKLIAELEGCPTRRHNACWRKTRRPRSGGTDADRRRRGAMIPRQAHDGPQPLSFPQERLFLLDQIMPGLPAYNVPTLVRVGATLDDEPTASGARRDRRPPRDPADDDPD